MILSARSNVLLRCAPRQDRVASLTTWSRLAAGTPSPSRNTPGVGFRGSPTFAFTTSQTKRSGSVVRWIGAPLATSFAVPMYISLVPSLSPRLTRLSNFASSLVALPRVLSNRSRTRTHRKWVTLSSTVCHGMSRTPSSRRCPLQTMRPSLRHA